MKKDSAEPTREDQRKPESSPIPAESEFSHTLYHNDLSALAVAFVLTFKINRLF